MLVESDKKLDYDDVLIRPKRSELFSRQETDPERQLLIEKPDLGCFEMVGIPLIAANMDGVGTWEMAQALADKWMFTCLRKAYDNDQLLEFMKSDPFSWGKSFISIGVNDDYAYKFDEFFDESGRALHRVCIDSANGYSEVFLDFVQRFAEKYENVVLMAGNVCTPDQTQELILNGVDIVKVGIGPGAFCETRKKTGVGYPQLSAVIECADAAHGLGGYIVADGGCSTPGDICKAFGGGADFVMLGTMLAGHTEGLGKTVQKKVWNENFYETVTKNYVPFYGMSSRTANDKWNGGLKGYRTSEGKEGLVEFKGSVDNTLQDILGGIRSCMTYIGAERIKDIPKCTTFVLTR